eukprot:COSAG05_NODE_180_length_14817_cov_423.925262_3_plen_48_part_00
MLTEFTTKCFEQLETVQAFLAPWLAQAEKVEGVNDWTGGKLSPDYLT